MNELLGPFEKGVIAVLIVLLGIYFALDRYCPSMFYPELDYVHKDLSVSMKPEPRKGEIIPVSEFSAYLSNASNYQGREQIGGGQGSGSLYDPTKIQLFKKGLDGKDHPVNSYLLGFVPFQSSQYWLPLLAVSLRVRYMRDDEYIPGDDTWQTSLQTYTRGLGDCEDHAILLADWMIGLGYDARVVIGNVKGQGHAWVVLIKDGKEFLLEATDKASRRRYPLVELHPEYDPVAMFNQDHFWGLITENRGWNNRLSTQSWVILSDFKEMYF
ncbi:MAG: transglutaminase-like domain-containing protein [Candidatus Omnitrophota bacterium]